jgi:hypothetical protein
MMRQGPIEDGTHENPADDILVVQVRRLGPMVRDVSEFAVRRHRDESAGQ